MFTLVFSSKLEETFAIKITHAYQKTTTITDHIVKYKNGREMLWEGGEGVHVWEPMCKLKILKI